MKYTAVNTKINAMRANLLKIHDYEALYNGSSGLPDFQSRTAGSLQDDLHKILPYIYEKPTRDFVKCMVHHLDFLNATGRAPAKHDAPNIFWAYALWQRLGLLDKSSREAMRRVLGTEIDMRNILWIYRLKRYHKIEGTAVISFLVPVCHRLSPDDTNYLAATKNLTEFLEAAEHGPYGKIFRNAETFHLGERTLSHALCGYFKRERDNLTNLCAYLYERHLEIKNIYAITAAKTHGIPPEEILSRLL